MFQLSDFIRVALRFLTLRRVVIADFPNSPALLALLWITATAANVVGVVLWPDDRYLFPSSVLFLPGTMLLAALVASWMIGQRTDAIRLGIAFMLVGLVLSIAWSGVRSLALPSDEAESLCLQGLGLWAIIAVAVLLRKGWGQSRLTRGTVLASVFFGFILVSGAKMSSFDGYLMSFSPRAAADNAASESYAPIDHETLWPAQPALVETAAASLRARDEFTPRTTVLAVAAGGSQEIFGREAHAVLAMLSGRLGQGAHGALLSNARADLGRVPLATKTNLTAILQQAGKGFDSSRDLMVIYLAAHGSRDAELGTNLPDYEELNSISAKGLAASLDAAGIKRRIIVVSACFAGTWIRPLASPDTIVIAAAASDRTSFGCDDSREYTVFGEAFINGSLRRGAPFGEAFEDIKRRVAEEEAMTMEKPSLPQAYVGENMQGLWSAKAPAPVY